MIDKRMSLAFAVVSLSVAAFEGRTGSFAGLPEGWLGAGTHPQNYEMSIDATVKHSGQASGRIVFTGEKAEGFGTLMQSFNAANYLGKRVRFSAAVKTADVQSWAGLWMRIDKGSQTVEFDNMQNRPLKGTAGWKKYDVVLDVPQDATGIFFGVLLDSAGEVWLSDVKFEVVGTAVSTTGVRPKLLQPGPVNLDFQQP